MPPAASWSMRGGFCRPRTGVECGSQRADLGCYALQGMELMGLQLEVFCGLGRHISATPKCKQKGLRRI